MHNDSGDGAGAGEGAGVVAGTTATAGGAAPCDTDVVGESKTTRRRRKNEDPAHKSFPISALSSAARTNEGKKEKGNKGEDSCHCVR